MMEFSAEQKARAQRDVELLFARLCAGPMPGAAHVARVYQSIAMGERCQLNAAVELLRRIAPEQAVLKELEWHAAMQEGRDFLSAFPEGGKDE